MNTSGRLQIRCNELKACPLCGNPERRIVLYGYDFETQSGAYRIEECTICGIRFTNPQPISEDIPLLYAERTSEDFATGSAISNWLRRLVNRRLIRRLPKSTFNDASAVLDFGCGSGFFTTVARDLFGGRVVASDFHDTAPSPALDQLGIEYIKDSLLDQHTEEFDVIFCRNVLEHAIDPRFLLQRLGKLMRTGGYLLIEVPNGNSIWAHVFGKYCYNYYLPRHLFHFNRNTLCALLDDFDITRCWLTQSPLMGRSIGYRLGLDIGNMSLFGLALFPLQVMADAPLGRAPVLHIIARKAK